MTGLEDTFGPEFAEQVEERIQERRAERQKVGDDVKRKVAHLAVNEDRFKDGDPIFSYTSESGMTHDVMLVKLADPNEGTVWNQVRELDSGAVSAPLDYLGEWIWSIFNEKEMLKEMDEGEWYIAIGNLSQWEDDDGESHDQLSPVRGVLSLEQAKEFADSAMADDGFDESAVSESSGEIETATESKEDESHSFGSSDGEEDDEEEEDEDDSGGSGMFGGSSDESEEEEEDDDDKFVSQSDVDTVVEQVAEDEPDMWNPDEVQSEKETVMVVVGDNLEVDWNEDEEVAEDMWEKIIDRVERGPEEEEEEDDEEDNLF